MTARAVNLSGQHHQGEYSAGESAFAIWYYRRNEQPDIPGGEVQTSR
jgi:hypothetical protein